MRIVKHPQLRIIMLCILTLALAFTVCSPATDSDLLVNPEQTNPLYVLHGFVHAVIAVHSSSSSMKLVPIPKPLALYALIILMHIYRSSRLRIQSYPCVFLLLKQQLLLPIKFTSVFVNEALRSSKSS
ncbi:hypothetical protein ACFFK0_03620 [Paenibacillus chartarius]|uniref:Uncharacterized protein n=1 Tax=Paenibacillus chartarius TaxID=747481 RepID=A0ABV6DG23_9BACL